MSLLWEPLPAPEGDRPSNLTELLIKICLWENAQWRECHHVTGKIAHVVTRMLTIALSTVLLYALIGSMFAATLMWWPVLVRWEFAWLCLVTGYVVYTCHQVGRTADPLVRGAIGSPRYVAYGLVSLVTGISSVIIMIMLDVASKLHQ